MHTRVKSSSKISIIDATFIFISSEKSPAMAALARTNGFLVLGGLVLCRSSSPLPHPAFQRTQPSARCFLSRGKPHPIDLTPSKSALNSVAHRLCAATPAHQTAVGAVNAIRQRADLFRDIELRRALCL